MKSIHISMAALVVAVGLALHATCAQQVGIKRIDVVRGQLGAADREVIQVRVDIAPGAAFPSHSHPGVEVAYVLEGTLEYEIAGKLPVTLKAGQALFIPTGTIHSAKNVGASNASELATYIVERNKPLVVLAQ